MCIKCASPFFVSSFRMIVCMTSLNRQFFSKNLIVVLRQTFNFSFTLSFNFEMCNDLPESAVLLKVLNGVRQTTQYSNRNSSSVAKNISFNSRFTNEMNLSYLYVENRQWTQLKNNNSKKTEEMSFFYNTWRLLWQDFKSKTFRIASESKTYQGQLVSKMRAMPSDLQFGQLGYHHQLRKVSLPCNFALRQLKLWWSSLFFAAKVYVFVKFRNGF